MWIARISLIFSSPKWAFMIRSVYLYPSAVVALTLSLWLAYHRSAQSVKLYCSQTTPAAFCLLYSANFARASDWVLPLNM